MFWVFDWLKENRISSLPQAAERLSKASVLHDLEQRAATNSKKRFDAASGPLSVLAGMGIDLAGGLGVCPSPACMRGQVDELFKRVWHYFDRIVVNDVFTPLLLSKSEQIRNVLPQRFISHLAPLLYLREIQAEDLVEFVPKFHCKNWQKHAAQEGLQRALDSRGAFADYLRNTSKFYHSNTPSESPTYYIENPEISTPTGIWLAHYPGKSEQELQDAVISVVIEENLIGLTADVTSAHQFQLPLGSIIGVQGRMLATSHPPSAADVILHLELPVLDGISTKHLIEFRRQEQDSFIQFRSSLTEAIQERLRIGPAASAQSLANEIRNDVVEPALSKIRRRLETSETLLAKKSGVGLFLGALATTCGLLCGLPGPESVSAGVGATVATTWAAADKHLQEQQQVSLDDMYFLWKATKHFH